MAAQTPAQNKYWNLLKAPVGFPVQGPENDIDYVTEDLPALKDGEVLIKVLYMSLDPYMRGRMNPVSYGQTQSYPRKMTGGAVGEVIESKSDQVAVGDVVLGVFGWQQYAIASASTVEKVSKDLPLSYYLGVLGMPGATAYFGFLEICTPQPGELVVVSAATGAVGQLVGQIAKIKGCTVIGFASSDDKCKWAQEIGYDHCINYKGKTTEQLTAELKNFSPNGVNCYFDNTGGPCTEAVFNLLALRARVSVCGQIAYYNAKEVPKTNPMTMICLMKQAKVEGFIVNARWNPKTEWPAAHAQLAAWIKEGKLKVREQVVEGLDNAFKAFLTLFQDSSETGNVNFGKLVVKVA